MQVFIVAAGVKPELVSDVGEDARHTHGVFLDDEDGVIGAVDVETFELAVVGTRKYLHSFFCKKNPFEDVNEGYIRDQWPML
jgi:hypothetical protein